MDKGFQIIVAIFLAAAPQFVSAVTIPEINVKISNLKRDIFSAHHLLSTSVIWSTSENDWQTQGRALAQMAALESAIKQLQTQLPIETIMFFNRVELAQYQFVLSAFQVSKNQARWAETLIEGLQKNASEIVSDFKELSKEEFETSKELADKWQKVEVTLKELLKKAQKYGWSWIQPSQVGSLKSFLSGEEIVSSHNHVVQCANDLRLIAQLI
jgi:hypothetical protein